MKPWKEYEPGDKVRVTKEYRRKWIHSQATWESVEVDPWDGVYMGFRHVAEGRIYPEERFFVESRRIPNALVVFHPYRAPKRVPFDSLEKIKP